MKIEIGGGNSPVEGFEQLECRWGYEPLPLEDESVDELYASHVIEHIPWWLSQQAIDDAHRVLKVGGTLEVHTVDFRYLTKQYLNGLRADDWTARGHNPDLDSFLSIASRIFSVGDEDKRNWHRAIFDREYLDRLFSSAGFVDLIRPDWPLGRQKHGPINIGIRGVK